MASCEDSRANGPPINAVCDQGDDSSDSFSGFLDPEGRFAVTTKSVRSPHLPGFVRSDVESCHSRIKQISPQRNHSCTHLPLEDVVPSSNDICDRRNDRFMSAMRALVLHLGGVGECVRLIWGWSDHGQESGDLQGGRFAILTKSVHCPHLPGFVRSDVESCHGRIEQISPQRNSSHYLCPVHSWVHVFGKLVKTSSLWTQGASVAYTEQPTTKKARHHCNRRARKKLNKQYSVLTEATIPQSVLTNLLSTHEIDNEIIVFDRGGIDNPPIKPPDGVFSYL